LRPCNLIATEKENKAGFRKQLSEDYYSGYYWGNEPYHMFHLK